MSLMPGFLRKKAKQAVQEPPPLPSKSFPVSVKADVAPPPLFARFATTTQAQATNGGAPGPPKVVSAPMSLQSGKSQKRSSLSSTPSTSSRTTTATQRNGARMPIPVTEKPLPPPSPYSEPPPPDPRQRHVSAPSSRAPQAVPPSVPIGQLSAGVRSRVSDVSPPASDPPPATKSSMKRPDTSQGTYIAESNAKTSAKRGSFSTPARPVPNDIASTPPASFGRQHGQSEQKQRRMNSQDLWGNSSGAPLSAGSSPAYPTGAAIQYGATVLQTNGHARDTSSLLVDLPPEVSLFHAYHETLATPVSAPVPIPPETNSAPWGPSSAVSASTSLPHRPAIPPSGSTSTYNSPSSRQQPRTIASTSTLATNTQSLSSRPSASFTSTTSVHHTTPTRRTISPPLPAPPSPETDPISTLSSTTDFHHPSMGIAASHIRSPADFLPTSGVGHSLYTTATGPSVGGSQPTSKRASIGVQPAPNGTTVSTNQKLHSRKLPDPVAQRPHQTLPGAGTGPGASPSIIAPLNLAPVPGTSRRPSASASTNTPPLSKPRGLPDAPVGNGGETQDGVPTPNPNGRHVMNGPRAGNPTQPFPSPLSAPFATLPQPQPQPQPPHSTPSSSMPVDKQSRRTSRPPLPTPPTHATPYVAPVPIPQPPASIAPVVFDKEVSSSPEEGRLKVQRMDTTSSVSGRSDDDASAVPAVPSTTDATDDLSALSPEEAKRLKREAKEQRRREREQRRRLRAEKKAAAAAYAELQTQAQVQTQELAPRAAESLPVEAPPALQIAAISSGEAAVTAPSSPSVEPSELVQDEQAGKEEVAAPVDDTPKPPAITMAELLSYPPVFANLLSFFSFYDWCNLSATTREIRVLLVNVKDLKEVALERFLKTVGYARWAFPEPEPLALTLQDLSDYMRGVSIPTHEYARVARMYVRSLSVHPNNRDISLPDLVRSYSSACKAYNRVLLRLRAQAEKEALVKQQQAEKEAKAYPPSASKSAAAASRAPSRAPSPTMSMYSQSYAGQNSFLNLNGSQVHLPQHANSSQTNLNISFRSPLFKVKRAPLLRVFVPSPEGDWLSDKSVLECEAECKRSGVMPLMRLGDVVWDVAVGDEGNVGRLVWDGSYLIDLDYTYTTTGDLPKYLHALAFPPSYFHRVIRTGPASSNPIVHVDISPWGEEIAMNLQLLQDRVRTETPQGNYHNVVRWVHRSQFMIRPPRGPARGVSSRSLSSAPSVAIPGSDLVVDSGWYGTIVVETEGTNEALAELQARCGPGAFPPRARSNHAALNGKVKEENRRVWRIMRERSRPGEIWLRAVGVKERLL